jgi:putative peptide zinc metalloprotease protein
MSGTFSEHWHRVANQRVAPRPTVQTRKQLFRDEKWFLVLDPLNNQFFRITPAAHEFICRLSGGATVQEVWEQCLERDPDGAPGQEEVIQLLSQLFQANLLRGEIPPDSAKLLERYHKRRRRELRTFLNLMFLRFPLFDPDTFLQRALPAVRWLMSPAGAVLWLIVVGAAIKIAFDHADALRTQSEGVLAPGNLVLLYAGLLLIKGLHEFGHAFACRRFGGEVHQMGVMLMYFSPVPYVDATSSWAFRSKWQRIFVGAAGMIVEVFVAALAVFVWASTGEGALHSLAYNMIFVASVTTVLFNANPLLRYDGYYILSDLLGMPNLQSRSMQMLRHLTERNLFGCGRSHSPTHRTGEGVFLALFGATSWIYRVLVFFRIALFISDQYLLLGLLMALACVYSFTVKPIWMLISYLLHSQSLARNRPRAIAVTCGAAAALVLALGYVPMPNRFRAPGILQAEEFSEVFTSTPGLVKEIGAQSSSVVTKGQQLLVLESRELELELAAARAELARAIIEEQRALARSSGDLVPLQTRRAVSEKRVSRLEEQQTALIVRAPQPGMWAAPEIKESLGQWFPRGRRIGQLIRDTQFRFTAVISQEEAAELFAGDMKQSQVRIRGQADRALSVQSMRVIPAQQELLPSAALGWPGGGEVAISQHDPSGVRAAVPFFELRALVEPDGAVKLLQGRSGTIRVELGSKPLLLQWDRKLRQLLQKKYQL